MRKRKNRDFVAVRSMLVENSSDCWIRGEKPWLFEERDALFTDARFAVSVPTVVCESITRI
jgi:hypothetical protein